VNEWFIREHCKRSPNFFWRCGECVTSYKLVGVNTIKFDSFCVCCAQTQRIMYISTFSINVAGRPGITYAQEASPTQCENVVCGMCIDAYALHNDFTLCEPFNKQKIRVHCIASSGLLHLLNAHQVNPHQSPDPRQEARRS
jgi:hypothetical protein